MSKGHVLVVEDNLDNYELVRTILELLGSIHFWRTMAGMG